jgi:hypothetical protein
MYPSPTAVDASTAPSDYLREILDDEYELGRLLGWGNIEKPAHLVPNFWLWGSHHGESGAMARLARNFLPRWRRYWSGAGELVARCELNILQSTNTVSVSARRGTPVFARYANFPSRDEAIFYAMCKASILCLQAEKDARAEERAAEYALRVGKE